MTPPIDWRRWAVIATARAGETAFVELPARREDLTGLPPAWIGVGDLDLFHDEDVAYARRLEAAGVPVQLHVEPGMYHGADTELHTTVPTMRAFRQQMFDALALALTSTGRAPSHVEPRAQ